MAEPACAKMSPAIFHELAWNPDRRLPSSGFAEAVAICSICPCRPGCLDLAISMPKGAMQGVMAGFSPPQIDRMREARNA